MSTVMLEHGLFEVPVVGEDVVSPVASVVIGDVVAAVDDSVVIHGVAEGPANRPRGRWRRLQT